jgi:undecaprenyl-diphosphatase
MKRIPYRSLAVGATERHRASVALVIVVGLACAAAALVLFAWLAGEVREGELRPFDSRVYTTLYRPDYLPHLTTFMERITALGSGQFLVPLALGLVLAFLLSRRSHDALVIFITLAGAGFLEWVLKLWFKIPRPTVFHVIPLPNSYSFPSGHALVSFCFYGVLASFVAGYTRNRLARLSTWIIAAILVVLIGISRIYLGVHNASDVLAGSAAAFVWFMTLMVADRLPSVPTSLLINEQGEKEKAEMSGNSPDVVPFR